MPGVSSYKEQRDRSFYKDKIRGSMLGLAIGDALGMAVEMATRSQILAATGGKGITGFEDIPRLSKIEDTHRLAIGATTDDTQLAFVVARSLIRKKTFDLLDMAHAHADALRTTTFGWGGTTRDAVREILTWEDSNGLAGRDPRIPSRTLSLGTGVAMKVPPLALFDSLSGWKDPHTVENLDLLGTLTHGDPRATLAAYAIYRMVQHGIKMLGGPLRFYLSWTLQEKPFADEERLIKERFMSVHPPGLFGDRLRKLDDALKENLEPLYSADPSGLLSLVGTSFSVMEAVPLAIGVAIRHPYHFQAAVCEAVNMGGDTDTVASMVGAIVGACVGASEIPDCLKEACHSSAEALDLADQLFDAAFSTVR